MYEKGVVIIGGGHGGSQVAASLRQEGYDGPLTLLTAEEDIPYQRPPLSKAFLKEPDHDLLPLRPASFYEKNDIDLRLNARATAIDTTGGAVALADGATVPADRIVIATGSQPRLPPISGIDLDGVFTLRDAADARAIRERLYASDNVVVVGGGFIGLEIAGTARLMGKQVTVLEMAGRLMARAVAPEISSHFLALHQGWGSDIRLDTAAGSFVGEGGRLTAVTTAGGDTIAADIAIVGTGVAPDTAIAAAAGIGCNNGISVDDFAVTDNPAVLAIGDAVSFGHWHTGRRMRLESVQHAVDQAKVAALAIVGRPKAYREVPWFWSDQGDVKLQMAGLPFGASESHLRGDPASGSFSVFHYDEGRLVAADSVNRAGDHMVARRLMEAGLSPQPEAVSDESVNLRALYKELTSA